MWPIYIKGIHLSGLPGLFGFYATEFSAEDRVCLERMSVQTILESYCCSAEPAWSRWFQWHFKRQQWWKKAPKQNLEKQAKKQTNKLAEKGKRAEESKGKQDLWTVWMTRRKENCQMCEFRVREMSLGEMPMVSQVNYRMDWGRWVEREVIAVHSAFCALVIVHPFDREEWGTSPTGWWHTEQVAQGGCECSIPGGIQGQAGCGSGQPGLVVGDPAHGRRVETRWSLWSFSTQAILWFYDTGGAHLITLQLCWSTNL